MCRSIKRLYRKPGSINEDEAYEAALQFVRKVTGIRKPSLANKKIFDTSVSKITRYTYKLINGLSEKDEKRKS